MKPIHLKTDMNCDKLLHSTIIWSWTKCILEANATILIKNVRPIFSAKEPLNVQIAARLRPAQWTNPSGGLQCLNLF
jgi:hypothetical protein